MTAKDNADILGFCYASPEKLTNGTWNMLAIGVATKQQSKSKGVGSFIVSKLEEYLRDNGARVMIVDTSGTDTFIKTRAFYLYNDYQEVACLPDFWDEGDDKITLFKKLPL